MTYFTAETPSTGFVLNAAAWQPTDAPLLSDAKRAASKAQMFQGTAVWVGRKTASGDIRPIAVKRADALNMRLRGVWESLE